MVKDRFGIISGHILIQILSKANSVYLSEFNKTLALLGIFTGTPAPPLKKGC